MGVYIKGMEMPDKCGHCRFATAFNCGVDGQFITTHDARRKDCPLVPVPKHGRLIDADALDASLKEMSEIEWNQKAFPVSWAYAFEAFRGIIERDEPTIIEAEEEGK